MNGKIIFSQMNSLVCMAYVPDGETKIVIGADGKSIDESDVRWIVSPFDEFALEEAVKLKESGGGVVTVVSVGPERAKSGLRECLARGADDAIWVQAATEGDLDALGVAKNIAAVYREGSFDLLWFGQKGLGWEDSVVGPMTAELLGLPHIGEIVKFEVTDGSVVCEREIEGAQERVVASIPCVLTAQKGLNEPRYPSLKGIMGARRKAIREKPAAAFASVTNVRRLELTPPPKPCRFVPGGDPKASADGAAYDPAGAARELARILREEAKVI